MLSVRVGGFPLFVLALCFGLSGCSATQRIYEGMERSATEVAIIEEQFEAGGWRKPEKHVQFLEVDGVPVSTWKRAVEILPGTHIVKAYFSWSDSIATRYYPSQKLTIEVQAGSRYKILGSPAGLWLEQAAGPQSAKNQNK